MEANVPKADTISEITGYLGKMLTKERAGILVGQGLDAGPVENPTKE